MKVWLDILTPKQANFLGALHHRLISKGFKTFLTTREYREVNELLELKRISAVQVGRHGGGELKSKLVQSSIRVSELAEVVKEQNPDVAISFSSPEAARVAFGLKIPHYCVSDSPHAEAVSRLTVPLSKKLFTPWVVPSQAWTKYGISSRDVVRYKALDPVVWLPQQGNLSGFEGLRLDRGKPVIVVRTTEEFAAYLTEQASNLSNRLMDIVEKLLEVGEGLQTVVLPRYEVQRERLKRRFGNRVIVPEHIVDSVSLMRGAAVFIGGGGTMTAEAALLGNPVISYYPGDATFVDKFLINQGLVERVLDPGRVAQRAVAISRNPEEREFHRKKSSRLMQRMEDPLEVITERVFRQ